MMAPIGNPLASGLAMVTMSGLGNPRSPFNMKAFVTPIALVPDSLCVCGVSRVRPHLPCPEQSALRKHQT
jgi:hypothetical protein